jgi:heptosyltransferase-3
MSWTPGLAQTPRKILLIQLRRIGDAVLVTPAIEALRDAWPAAELHLLTASPVEQLFEGDSRLARVWVRPSRSRLPALVRDLRAERFDLVFDFQSAPLTAFFAAVTGAFTVGFRRRWRRYHRAVELQLHQGSHYAADHKLDLLRAVGLMPRSLHPRLADRAKDMTPWSDLPPGPKVAMVPVSPWAHKRWSPEAFAETARLLHQETGAVFVVAGGPGEETALREVADRLGDVPHRVHAFGPLRDLAAFLAGADLYLGNDNGPRHIALAQGVPTIARFSRDNPTHWTPPADPRHPVIWDASHVQGRAVRGDLIILPENPIAVARAAAGLLRLTKEHA